MTFNPTGGVRGRTLAAAAVAVPIVLLPQILKPLTAQSGFHGHGYCYLWEPALVGVNVASDVLIGLSYVAISATLAYFVLRGRDRIPFHWIFLAFGVFIVACGVGHFVDVLTMWTPAFFLEGNVRILTAMASVGTAVILPSLVPKALRLVEAAQLSEERKERLDAATRELAALDALRESEEQRARLLEREKELRAQAEAASRMKDEFLATISHELRTPLTAMLGWARLLALEPIPDARTERAVQAIERNARAQAHLIEDLLDVSRIITGKMRMDVRPLDLSLVIDAALEAVRPAADAKQIRLHKVLGTLPAPVTGDAARLQQAMWNLLSNAIRFTPRGGRVEVALQRMNSHIEITVADTGIGIRPEFLPHVFERFTQGDTGMSRLHGGLGIGLGIVRHIVELHGGTVQAFSEGESLGATFSIHLPMTVARFAESHPASALAEARHVPVAIPVPVSLEGVKVLAVDDDGDSRDLLATILRAAGAQVVVTESAAAAIDALGQFGASVVVSDIEMPGTSGYDLIRTLRAREAAGGRRLAAVALTAHARVEDRLEALTAGFDVHVPKPVEPAELVAVVAALTRRMASG